MPRWSVWPWPSTIRRIPPSFAPARGDRAHHRARAGVEHRHAALVLDQVHVAAARLALHDPHALGDQLRARRARERAGQPRLGVERAGHPLFGGRVLRRQHADLARERHRVGERVVALDQPVAHGQQVDSFELDAARRSARCRRREPGPANVPRSRHCTAQRSPCGGRLQTTSMLRSGTAVDQLAEERAHALRRRSCRRCPRTCSRPPGAHSATAASRSRASIASK